MARRPTRRLGAAAVSLLILVSTAACGTYVSRARIEAAAGMRNARTGQDLSAGSGGQDGSTNGTANSSNGVAGLSGGSVSGGGGSVNGGQGGAAGSAGAAGSVGSIGGGSAGGSTGGGGATAILAVANLSPIKLGHIGTYSGLLGAIFAGGTQTAQVWANWTNAHGGLHGHPVQVVTGDDGGDPSRNLSLARDMVENQHVLAFLGDIVPLSLNGSKAYLEQKQIPVIGGDLTDVGWYQSPMFFPQGALIDGPLKGSAQQAVKQGGPRVALLYCGEASACFRARDLFQQGAVQAAGGQLVYTAQVSLAQPDFTGECIQLRSNQVNAVVATVDGNSLSRLAAACQQQNVRVKYVSFALALVSSLRSDSNLDGLVGTTALFPWMLSSGPAANYARAIATFAPNLNTSGTTAAVWGSGELVQAASRSLPFGQVATRDLLDGLYALKGDTLGGLAPPLTFRRGQPPAPYNCYYTISLAHGVFDTPSGLQATC